MSKSKKNPFKHRVQSVKGQVPIMQYCAQHFPILGSKTAVKKAILKEQVFLNDSLATIMDFVRNGDFIQLKKIDNKPVVKSKFDLEMPIVFEDDHLIIVDKPGGIAVNGNRNKTVENAVINLAQKSKEPDALPAPTAVHRLDVPTKGLVMLAKTKTALIRLNRAFQKGEIGKVYFAIVHGQTPEKGRIETPIDGKESTTEYDRIKTAKGRGNGQLSLVKLKPITGRTHQLRIHLQSIGHLVLGDKQYAGRQRTLLKKGLFLCACNLRFEHPITRETMQVRIPIPKRFERLVGMGKKTRR
jgi:RluA family pseudouridine synthase